MKLKTWYVQCSHCGRSTLGLQGGPDAHPPPGTQIYCLCRSCRKTLIAEVRDDGQGGFTVTLIDPPATASDPAPTSVVDTINEAAKCLSIDALLATALLLRRAVELVVTCQGVKGKNLFYKIEHLCSAGRLPSILKSVADEVRELGNDAAHEDMCDWEFPQPGKLAKPEELDMWLRLSRGMVGWFYAPDEVNKDFDQMSAITGQDPGSS